MAKIIQIAACGHDNNSSTQSSMSLLALTDDGRLWLLPVVYPLTWEAIPLPCGECCRDMETEAEDAKKIP